MNLNLDGRVAFVTGAGGGIGFAIAKQLGLDGYNIVMVATGPQEKNQPALDVLNSFGINCAYVQANIGCADDRKKILDGALAAFGRVDVLVNNAGITRDGLLMKMSEEDFDAVINTNLKGCFHCMRFVSRQMLKQRSGRIINLSSVSGVAGNAGQANYAASKAGIIGLTKTVARELASRGITVNAVAPGFVHTEMTEVLSEQVKEAAVAQIPLGRFGEPEDIANVVAFLASEKADYITGQVICVDGGMAM